ncbi:MAG: ABC transporter permease subunit [Candidatus Dojkabacteria bacterium]|nr:ABC transporter permease subunit [Candidatus Dojkabacteria bacterium]
MLGLIKRTIAVKKRTVLVYAGICALLNWVFVLFYPHMHEQAEVLTEAFSNYPEEFLMAFNVDASTLFLSLESFLAAENFSMLWPIILIVFIISLAGSAIAGEVDDGTIEILLSQPVSRSETYLGKYLAGIFLVFIFVFLSIFSTIPFAWIHNIDFTLKTHLIMSILGMLFAFAIFSFAMMVSAISSGKGKVGAYTAGFVVAMYVLKLLSTFQESVQNLKYLSFFHYFDVNAALIESRISLVSIIVFCIFGIATSLVGLLIFQKRDVAV